MEIPFDHTSKIVLISDCHKGDGSWADDFSHNQNIFYSALKYYYNNGFTYIDLGDSDELWKNKDFSAISVNYPDTFRLIRDFYTDDRLYIIFGNHDIVKRDPQFIKKKLTRFYDSHKDRNEPLFDTITIHEGLILRHTETNKKIFLIHGHQGDLIADILWKFGRFLTRHVWRKIESFGLKDPTSAAINYEIMKKVEKKIIDWVSVNKQTIICGHTHRPSCPTEDSQPYFNDGCCIFHDCMTCLEIVNSEITLIKWDIKTNENRIFYVDRETISGPRDIAH
jgi:UDP-2,3-diacylglucosamine pyrophosphatase LpxH